MIYNLSELVQEYMQNSMPLLWNSLSVFTNPATNARGKAWSHSSRPSPRGIAFKTWLNKVSLENIAAALPLCPSKIWTLVNKSAISATSILSSEERSLMASRHLPKCRIEMRHHNYKTANCIMNSTCRIVYTNYYNEIKSITTTSIQSLKTSNFDYTNSTCMLHIGWIS